MMEEQTAQRENMLIPSTGSLRRELDSKSVLEEEISWSPIVTGGKSHYSDNSQFSNDLQLLIRDKDSYDGKKRKFKCVRACSVCAQGRLKGTSQSLSVLPLWPNSCNCSSLRLPTWRT